MVIHMETLRVLVDFIKGAKNVDLNCIESYTCNSCHDFSDVVKHLRVSVLSILFPYAEAIFDYCGGNLTVTGVKATAGIFATYPAPYLSLMAGFVDQVAMKPD